MADEQLEHEQEEAEAHAVAVHPETEEADSLEEGEPVAMEEVHHEEAAPAAPPVDDVSVVKHWYIIHAYSGFEQKVAESLKTRSQAFGFAERLGQILIPTEEVVELRNGKKVTSKRLLYPGYVLVEMEMDDELWHAVKSTPRVTGFVGGGTKPVPLTADEVNSVLYRQASSAERPAPEDEFRKERNGQDHRRTVHQLLRQGGRDQPRAQHAARDGDHFWTLDAGGTRLPASRKDLTNLRRI